MKIHLSGHLVWYQPQHIGDLDIPLDDPTPMVEVLAKLNIPAGEIVLVVVNGELADDLSTVVVSNDDQVDLYPPLGGGSK